MRLDFASASLAFIIILAVPLSGSAAEQREMIVAVDSWPPFRMVEEQPYSGIDFDLWEEIGRRLGIKIKFEKYPWARCLYNMKHGTVDAMGGLAKRTERAKYMHYTIPPYFSCSTVFYVRKGEGHVIEEYADLYDQTIGHVNESVYFHPFDTDTAIRKHGVYAERILISMLAAKRLNVFIGTDCQADYDIIQQGHQGEFEKAKYRPGNTVDLYLGISKKSPFAEEMPRINEVIRQIVDEGKIEEFQQKYLE